MKYRPLICSVCSSRLEPKAPATSSYFSTSARSFCLASNDTSCTGERRRTLSNMSCVEYLDCVSFPVQVSRGLLLLHLLAVLQHLGLGRKLQLTWTWRNAVKANRRWILFASWTRSWYKYVRLRLMTGRVPLFFVTIEPHSQQTSTFGFAPSCLTHISIVRFR